VSTLRTRFCRELGVDYPTCSVGMRMAAGPKLAAVSNAGGFGVTGTHGLSAEAIQESSSATAAPTAPPRIARSSAEPSPAMMTLTPNGRSVSRPPGRSDGRAGAQATGHPGGTGRRSVVAEGIASGCRRG
jgi:NAD(P)H-dependent flavin oxidoreductase YrpB (nitropropane dioxygenase family)